METKRLGAGMQILESGPLGLRSAAFWLAGREPWPTFLVMPMVHMGSRHFYEHVCKLLDECDIVLAEGVDHKTARILFWLRSYVARSSKFSLIDQQEGMREWFASNRDRIRQFDMPKDVFAREWGSLNIFKRWLFSLYHIFGFVAFRIIASRQILAEAMAKEDKRSREEILREPYHSQAYNIILHKRDAFMINLLREYLASDFSNGKIIGVVAGAGHARAIYDYLISQQRFTTIKSEWLTVFADSPEFDDQPIK